MSVEVIHQSGAAPPKFMDSQSKAAAADASGMKQAGMSPKHHALLEGARREEGLGMSIGIHSRHASVPESLLLKGTSPVSSDGVHHSNGFGWSTPKPDTPVVKLIKSGGGGGGGKIKQPNTRAIDQQQQNARTTDEESVDYDSSLENTSSVSSFDFNSKDPQQQRPSGGAVAAAAAAARSIMKPAPSKWDDAEKWLVSSDVKNARMKQLLSAIPSHVLINASKKAAMLGQQQQQAGAAPRGTAGGKLLGVDVLLDKPDAEPPDVLHGCATKKIDGPAYKFSFMPSPGIPAKTRSLSSLDRYPLEELQLVCDDAKLKLVTSLDEEAVDDDLSKPALRTEKPTSDFPEEHKGEHLQSPGGGGGRGNSASYVAPPPGVRSVSMRDMGTEMTPIASQEPSRTGTPLRATTPTIRSPVSSRPSTPGRLVSGTPQHETGNGGGGGGTTCDAASQCQSLEQTPGMSELLSEKHKMRQEIRALGTQLGKANIAAWASREEEEEDASKCLKNIDLEEVKRNVLETRAAAWEEAEKAKYEARYKREESKIIAWENHEKAKAEAEMRRIEVKVERMRSHSHEELMNKLATARRRAEDLRAAAESRRVEQASKTAQRAEYIRQTGNMPPATSSPLSAFLHLGRWCC